MEHRRELPDGRIVVVERFDDTMWSCMIEGKPESEVVGWPLASTFADTLGYHVAHETWPEWIDHWAAEIERNDSLSA